MRKFRWHRGGLAESMATVVEFDGTKESLIDILTLNALPLVMADPKEVVVEPYAFDERIGWDTHIVTYCGFAVGFTDGALVPAPPSEETRI